MLLASNNCCVKFACKASMLLSSHQSQIYTKCHLQKTSTCQIKQLALQLKLGCDKAPGFTTTSPSKRVCTGCCITSRNLPGTLSSTPCTPAKVSLDSLACHSAVAAACTAFTADAVRRKALTLSHDCCQGCCCRHSSPYAIACSGS